MNHVMNLGGSISSFFSDAKARTVSTISNLHTSAQNKLRTYTVEEGYLSKAAKTTLALDRISTSFISICAPHRLITAAVVYDMTYGQGILSLYSATLGLLAATKGPTLCLELAVAFKSHKIASFLLQLGVDPNQQILISPLGIAALRKNKAMAELLLDNGADVNLKGPFFKLSPLHLSLLFAKDSHTDISKMLIEKGSDVNAVLYNDRTPIHVASFHGLHESIKLLIEKGADPFMVKSNGSTVFDEARQKMKTLLFLHNIVCKQNFSTLQEMHDYYNVKFPPSKSVDKDYKLPNWAPEINPFNSKDSRVSKKKTDSLQEIAKSRFPSKAKELLLLIIKDPLFEQAWQYVNSGQKIKIIELNISANENFQKSGFISDTTYDSYSHTINYIKGTETSNLLRLFIFETMNAVQRETFEAIANQASLGNLTREEFAIMAEYVEYRSDLWTYMVYESHYKTSNLEISPKIKENLSKDFSQMWLESNTIPPEWPISHTEQYRREWDKFYSALYLKKNPIS